MKAVMKIPTEKISETEFVHCPGKAGSKATELYVSSKTKVIGSRCIMEYGL